MTDEHKHGFFHHIEASAVLTIIGIFLLFSSAVMVTLIAPNFVDPMWTKPSSHYQVQMYEVADPNLYIGGTIPGSEELQFVYHLEKNYFLLAFAESSVLRIVSPPELEQYVTRYQNPELKLTSRLLLLRKPEGAAAEKARQLQQVGAKSRYSILELYDPQGEEAFAVAGSDGIFENFVDEKYHILDPLQPYHKDPGVIYVKNPQEYRIKRVVRGGKSGWTYGAEGEKVRDLAQLTSKPLEFRSRRELIRLGEEIYAQEGCWYCHSDQTRTLVQDVVLNGSDSYPAPASSPNEYIYDRVTFPGTRRIGPDLSRVGIKRPTRDWHKSHFWSPRSESPGSIMPSFQHFFDFDPRGAGGRNIRGVPNYRFEAVFQYLMTKGTRITSPTQAWWLGKDPVDTLKIIESKR